MVQSRANRAYVFGGASDHICQTKDVIKNFSTISKLSVGHSVPGRRGFEIVHTLPLERHAVRRVCQSRRIATSQFPKGQCETEPCPAADQSAESSPPGRSDPPTRRH